MTRIGFIQACCVFALIVGVRPLAAQAPVKPGPEHEMLKKFEGDWDATVSFMGSETKATSINKVGLGGLWLTTDYKGEFAGAKFEGKGTMGYDPAKKKYVTVWVDSMSPSILLMEGDFDKDGKTYTETGEGKGPDGKPAKFKSVYEFKDKDSMVFTMYMVVDGKDQEGFKITYKRK
jgi:hypothetical protein